MFQRSRDSMKVVGSGFCGCRWLWCIQDCLGMRLTKLMNLAIVSCEDRSMMMCCASIWFEYVCHRSGCKIRL